MGKKAKIKRKDLYKAFLTGMTTYRGKFIDKKMALLEKMLSDDALKSKILNKNRSEMNVLERAVVDTISSRELSSVESFTEIAEDYKEAQNKSAKFKYTPKKI